MHSIFLPLPLLLFTAATQVTAAFEFTIQGNVLLWDKIFETPYPIQIIPKKNDTSLIELKWTEGPLFDIQTNSLLFSSVIDARIYRFHLDSSKLEIITEQSGQAPEKELSWRAEPGSNGLASLPGKDHSILVCQHGARRLSSLHTQTRVFSPIATEWNGRKLNGPNDVIVANRSGINYAFFTDPVYAWLEKDRFEDLPYLDESVRKKGPGTCGVYMLPLDENISHEMKPVRIANMTRPNGLAFRENHLIVSDCCQGSHLKDCTQGISKWSVFEQPTFSSHANDGNDLEEKWTLVKQIVDEQPLSHRGCADSFKVDEKTGLLIASCAGGLCIVDVEKGKVVTRLRTSFKISNVALTNDAAYLTGEEGVWHIKRNLLGEEREL